MRSFSEKQILHLYNLEVSKDKNKSVVFSIWNSRDDYEEYNRSKPVQKLLKVCEEKMELIVTREYQELG